VGRAGDTKGATGLDSEMERELQEERTIFTARDRLWERLDNSRRHTAEYGGAEAPFRATKSQEFSASASTYRLN
jgi:hypothetical protein